MVLEVLYHGTKFKKTVDEILLNGFKEWSYFAYNLNDAIGMGGKYVFEVVFLKSELPDNWQVRCENAIPANRIISLSRFKQEEIIENKELRNKIFDNALELVGQNPYVFKEKIKIEDVLEKFG